MYYLLGAFILYIVGAITIYILDGWFNWSRDNDEEIKALCALWPLLVIFSPIILAETARDALKKAKAKKLAALEAEQKIRIAKEKEIEKISAELDAIMEEEKNSSNAA